MTEKQRQMRDIWSDPATAARMVSMIKSSIQDIYDQPPNPTLSELFDVWNSYNRDVECWASGTYSMERRAMEWVDLGGEAG